MPCPPRRGTLKTCAASCWTRPAPMATSWSCRRWWSIWIRCSPARAARWSCKPSSWSISSRAKRWACAPTPRRKWPALTRTCWGAKAWRAFATAGRCCTRGPSARWLRASRCKWARKFTATPGARPIWKSCCWRWTACAPPAWPRKGRSRSIWPMPAFPARCWRACRWKRARWAKCWPRWPPRMKAGWTRSRATFLPTRASACWPCPACMATKTCWRAPSARWARPRCCARR